MKLDYKVPYDFILRYLYPLRPKIVKMLGGYVLVLNDKILFMLREQEAQPEYNGVYIATEPDFYDTLESEIHSSLMEVDIDGLAHSWLFVSEDLPNFDEKVKKACEMLKGGDTRLGKKFTL